MCRISKIITFLESLRQAGWFDLFESDIQALLIFDHLITLWGNFDVPYLKLLNDASVASACFYVRTCRRVRNSKKIATLRDFHLPGSFLCLSTRLLSGLICLFFWGQFFKERIYRATCELFRLTPAAEGHDQLCHETAFITSVIIRVIHEKSNFKFLTSSSLILFILVIKYTMQNFSNFEKSLEGATGVSNFVHKVNGILEIKIFPAIFSHL